MDLSLIHRVLGFLVALLVSGDDGTRGPTTFSAKSGELELDLISFHFYVRFYGNKNAFNNIK